MWGKQTSKCKKMNLTVYTCFKNMTTVVLLVMIRQFKEISLCTYSENSMLISYKTPNVDSACGFQLCSLLLPRASAQTHVVIQLFSAPLAKGLQCIPKHASQMGPWNQNTATRSLMHKPQGHSCLHKEMGSVSPLALSPTGAISLDRLP